MRPSHNGAGCWRRWQRCSGAAQVGGRTGPWRAGGGRWFSARCPLELHDGLPDTYGRWASGARVARGPGVRIENQRAPPIQSLRSKQKYSTGSLTTTYFLGITRVLALPPELGLFDYIRRLPPVLPCTGFAQRFRAKHFGKHTEERDPERDPAGQQCFFL